MFECRDQHTVGAQPQRRHLHHSICIYGSEKIVEEGLEGLSKYQEFRCEVSLKQHQEDSIHGFINAHVNMEERDFLGALTLGKEKLASRRDKPLIACLTQSDHL